MAVLERPSASPSSSHHLIDEPAKQASVAIANDVRLQMTVNRLSLHFSGNLCINSSEIVQLIYTLARSIDFAITKNSIPKIAPQIPTILKKLAIHKNDSALLPAVTFLIISAKNACKSGWFQISDAGDILEMGNEFSDSFCMNLTSPMEGDNKVVTTMSVIASRYYPLLKFHQSIVCFEAKPGYDILMVDFFIQNKPLTNQKIALFIAKKDKLETSSCISGPPNASFLINGKGVEKRNNVLMESGPLYPSDITKMLKFGCNIIQAVGHFDDNYIIAVVYMSELTSFQAPRLDDYVKPAVPSMPADDDDVLEGPSIISLNCPISFKRIKTPIKGKHCKHYQCFDYENFMDMNSRKPTWRCPSCNSPACMVDLRIDQSMVKILQEVGPNISDVIISADGTWSIRKPTDTDIHNSPGEKNGEQEDMVGVSADHTIPIDLTMADDDQQMAESEDLKPFNVDHYLNEEMLLQHPGVDMPTSSVGTSHDVGANYYHGSTGPPASSSLGRLICSSDSIFGTLESILPENVLHPINRDVFSTPEESLQAALPSYSAMRQQMEQQMAETGRHVLPIHENVRRVPAAIQALAAPSQTPSPRPRPPIPRRIESRYDDVNLHYEQLPGTYNRGQASVPLPSQNHELGGRGVAQSLGMPWVYGLPASQLNLPRPPPQLPRVPGVFRGTQSDGPSNLDLLRSFINNPPLLPTSGPWGSISQPVQTAAIPSPGAVSEAQQINNTSVQLTLPLPARPPHSILSRSAPAANRPAASSQLQEEQPNWRPAGRMRGSLSGNDYVQALSRYTAPGRVPPSQRP